MTQLAGSLNPDWVEWLMGWPVGWTCLKPLEPGAIEDWMEKQAAGTWWDDDPANHPCEAQIPRVAKDVPDRVARLKAIGNGQVPAVEKTIYRIFREY